MTNVADLGVQGKDHSEVPDDKSKESLGRECHRSKGRIHIGRHRSTFQVNPNIFNSFCNLNFFSLLDIVLRKINFVGQKDAKCPC